MINEKEFNKIVAQNLRNLIYERNKNQATVAKELGINKATLSSWMNGTRTPKMVNIDMLCEYFGVPRSGGRTRTRSACIRTYSGIVSNTIPNQQKKSGASAPPL